ncbi:MAG: hypothetical protein AAFV90_01755 [Cyanobacteria bacterium J06634_5]
MSRLKLVGLKIVSAACVLMLVSCNSQSNSQISSTADSSAAEPASNENASAIASITAIETTGTPQAYNFSVTVESPDTGCDAYANWWEVITPEGDLLYRRILAHSHVDEQPFTRSGGPVAVGADEELIVRSHMYPSGYSPQAMQGNIAQGFTPTTLPEDFAQNLAETEPQPGKCAF